MRRLAGSWTPAPAMLAIALTALPAACGMDRHVETLAPARPSSRISEEPPPVPDEAFTGLLKAFKGCRAKYAEIDAKISAAGVGNAAYYRVPGFPYLRTDRTLASFRNEVHSVDEVGGWLRRMREFDQEARESELQNLGLDTQQRALWRLDLLTCGRGLASIELDDPAVAERLVASVPPPDQFPAAPVPSAAAPDLRARLLARQRGIVRDFARLATGPRVTPQLWRVKPEQDLGLIEHGYEGAIYDELGFPGLIESAWSAFAEANAPVLWIDGNSDVDRPGAPRWQASRLDVDTTRPAMHYDVTFTRFGDQRLPQIDYLYWFKGLGDDGGIDGFIWRVTLDRQAKPLMYESIHLSGRDHEWFLAQPAARAEAISSDTTLPPLFPQAGDVIGPRPVLRIVGASHALRQVVALDSVRDRSIVHAYDLRRYEDLTLLAKPDGGTRSLFAPDGTIPGIRDADPLWHDGIAIASPGALRELGHQPSDLLTLRPFDDPYLLDSVLVRPPAPVAER